MKWIVVLAVSTRQQVGHGAKHVKNLAQVNINSFTFSFFTNFKVCWETNYLLLNPTLSPLIANKQAKINRFLSVPPVFSWNETKMCAGK